MQQEETIDYTNNLFTAILDFYLIKKSNNFYSQSYYSGKKLKHCGNF